MEERLEPIFIAICDVCGKDKPIVLICLIGMKLCGSCQDEQNRISYTELRLPTGRC